MVIQTAEVDKDLISSVVKLFSELFVIEPAVFCPERLIVCSRRIIPRIRTVTLTQEWAPNQLAALQESDNEISPVINALKAGRKPSLKVMSNWPRVTKRLMKDWERLELRGGVLYRQWYNQQGRITRYQLVTPSQTRAQVLSNAYERAISGYFAVKRTIAKVREYFY